MKILLITGIFPPDIGGPASYVPRIAEALGEHGHNCRVLTLTDDCQDDSCYSFQVVRVPRSWPLWRRIPFTVAAIRRLGGDADVIYCNGLALETALANFVLCKPLVQKIVGDLAWERSMSRGWVTDGIDTFQRHRYGGKVTLLKWLRTWTTKVSDIIITPSHYLKTIVTGWGVAASKVRVIYNALDLDTDTWRGERQRYLAKRGNVHKFRVISVGRMVPWKGFGLLIDVAARLPWLYVTLVGEGPELGKLKHKASSLGVVDRVRFTGQLPHFQVLLELARSDVFVLNSGYEGLPHAALEALVVGVPVLLSDVGGNPEVVVQGANGFLFGYGNPASLIRRLSLLREGELTQFDEGTIWATLEKFRWPSLYAQTERVLESVL